MLVKHEKRWWVGCAHALRVTLERNFFFFELVSSRARVTSWLSAQIKKICCGLLIQSTVSLFTFLLSLSYLFFSKFWRAGFVAQQFRLLYFSILINHCHTHCTFCCLSVVRRIAYSSVLFVAKFSSSVWNAKCLFLSFIGEFCEARKKDLSQSDISRTNLLA